MNYYTHFQAKIKQVSNSIGLQDTNFAYITETIIVCIIALGTVGGYYGYQTYIEGREMRAYEAFVEVTHAYRQAQENSLRSMFPGSKSENLENLWKDVEVLADAGYNANSSSYLAPFFLSYKANVLLEQGKPVDQAYEYMKQALSKVSKRSDFYDVIKLKTAKLACDCSEESVRAQGLKDLQALAEDQTSTAYLEALYTLGVYYLVHNEIEKAKAQFTKIVDQETQGLFESALWINEAKEKLAAL